MNYHYIELSNDPAHILNLLHISTDTSTSRISSTSEMETSTSPQIGATLTCNCGETILRFDTRTPRAVVECCCDDCHARLQYCAKLGGPALEHGIYERTRPVRLVYFDNRLSVLKGRDNLRFFKLTPNSGVVNMFSSCCHTFLLKENVRYQGTVVAAIEQVRQQLFYTFAHNFHSWNNIP